jgi:hypothetical protein
VCDFTAGSAVGLVKPSGAELGAELVVGLAQRRQLGGEGCDLLFEGVEPLDQRAAAAGAGSRSRRPAR